MKKSIVWGTCWLNESISTLIEFYNTSICSLKKMNFDVIPIIFDAKYEDDKQELKYINNNIKDVIIIKNNVNIFPNKNYGIALITNRAHFLNADYTAIVDSDWNIKANYSFINNILLSLIKNNSDVLIPNISDASGRSNILIGKTIITLFYPDYKEILKTAFPGLVVAKTEKLYDIVNDKTYHFDWGGEWDIISIAINKKMKINSAYVDVENVRHRPNTSKIFDSFQIWRAVLGNYTILSRFENLYNCNIDVQPYNNISREILNNNCTIDRMIKILESNDSTNTEKQILFMILYPILFLSGKNIKEPIIEFSNKIPYDKKEIKKISNFAIFCAKKLLTECNIIDTFERCQNINGKFLSKWNFAVQEDLLKESVGESR